MAIFDLRLAIPPHWGCESRTGLCGVPMALVSREPGVRVRSRAVRIDSVGRRRRSVAQRYVQGDTAAKRKLVDMG